MKQEVDTTTNNCIFRLNIIFKKAAEANKSISSENSAVEKSYL